MALKRHYDRYLWERGNNHVKEEWEHARREEAEAAQLEYDKWLRQEVSTYMPVYDKQKHSWADCWHSLVIGS